MTSEHPQYWLTTQYPRVGLAPEINLYLCSADRRSDREPRRGDKMMIYELGAGPAGAGPHAKVVKGCGGIIAVAEVISGWALRTTSWEFTLEAECANHDFQGFAPRDALRQFDLGVGLIGFGDGSGILKMLVDEFTRLHKIFKSNNRCC